MPREWELVVPQDGGDKAMYEDGKIEAVYNTAMRSNRWKRGDVLPCAAYGGFFVQVVGIGEGPERTAWILTVEPLMGRTLVEVLGRMLAEALEGATQLERVEIALYVAEFTDRAMTKVRELERSRIMSATIFRIIDKETGREPDIEQIAATEDWADGLMWMDMEGFALLEDGSLLLLDECGNHRFCPSGRFEIQIR